MLQPLKRTSLAEDIINSIKSLIEQGDLKPGDKLPGERDLAAMLGVSRTSVREALRAMSVAGITTTRHGDGTYLNSTVSSLYSDVFRNCFNLFLELNDYIQFMEARTILETHLVELAAQRITQPLIDELENYLGQMKNNLHDKEALYNLDIQFHMVIYRAADNDILFQFFSTLNDLFEQSLHAVFADEEIDPAVSEDYKQHIRLFNCIKNHDSRQAVEVIKEHLKHADSILHQHLEKMHYTEEAFSES